MIKAAVVASAFPYGPVFQPPAVLYIAVCAQEEALYQILHEQRHGSITHATAVGHLRDANGQQ